MRLWKPMLHENWMMVNWVFSGIHKVPARVILWYSLHRKYEENLKVHRLLLFWPIVKNWTLKLVILLKTVVCLARQKHHSLLLQVVMILFKSWKAIQALSLHWFRNLINQMQNRFILITILSLCLTRLTAASMVFLQIIWWNYCRLQPV